VTSSGFTDGVRQELAALSVGDAAPIELGALLRAGGTLVRRGAGWSIELVTGTGAVARRAHTLIRALGGDPVVWVREATNVRRRSYGVVLEPHDAPTVGGAVGLLDLDGRPTSDAPLTHEKQPLAMLRGALLGAGSVSAPGRPPHLEIRSARSASAAQLARVLGTVLSGPASVGEVGDGYRVVLKSGAQIACLLTLLGAVDAGASHVEQRHRRALRADAQRLANADGANLRRAVDTAVSQVEMVERAIVVAGWGGLGDDLREVALARLANPAASLAEVGALCDPPIGKSAVHRRMARLRVLVEDADGG
jgi:DNA-binding protein WhiA